MPLSPEYVEAYFGELFPGNKALFSYAIITAGIVYKAAHFLLDWSFI